MKPFLPSQVAAFVSLGVIVVSTSCFILSTFPELQEPENEAKEETKSNGTNATDTSSTSSTTIPIDIDALIPDEAPAVDFDNVRVILRAIDMVTVCYFCLEYLVRFLCSPKKLKFFFQVRSLYADRLFIVFDSIGMMQFIPNPYNQLLKGNFIQ